MTLSLTTSLMELHFMLVILFLLVQACLLFASEKRGNFHVLRFTAALNQRNFEKARLILSESSSTLQKSWLLGKVLGEAVVQGDVQKARFIFQVDPSIVSSPCDDLFITAVKSDHSSMLRVFVQSPGFSLNADKPARTDTDTNFIIIGQIFYSSSLLRVLLLHRDDHMPILLETHKLSQNYLGMLADPRAIIEDSDNRPGVDDLRSCKLGVKPVVEHADKHMIQILMRCAGTHGHLRVFVELLKEFRELVSNNDEFLREIDYLADYAWTFGQHDIISAAIFNSGILREMPTEISLCLLWLEFKARSMEHSQHYFLAMLLDIYARHHLLMCFMRVHLYEAVPDIALAIWRTQIALLRHN